jgi:hypothetical protein
MRLDGWFLVTPVTFGVALEKMSVRETLGSEFQFGTRWTPVLPTLSARAYPIAQAAERTTVRAVWAAV